MGYQLEEKIVELISKVDANIPNVMNDIIETGTRNNIIGLLLLLMGCIICVGFLIKAIKMDEDSSDNKVFLIFLSTVILITLVGIGSTFASNLMEIMWNPDFYIYQQLFQPSR
ncbi:hypothetical protein [Proteus mirabilis]|uniref:hypothetical protein n=1 Tax=Proteus mirabilis TaxID=584 RepID=UPI0034D7AC19